MPAGIKVLATQYIREMFGDPNSATSFFAPGFHWHGPSVLGRSGGAAEQQHAFFAALKDAFPDLSCTTEAPVAEKSRVALRWTARGTHTGSALGAATGRGVLFTGIHLLDFNAGGKIVELWQQWGQMGLLQQINAMPFIGGPGSSLPGPDIEHEDTFAPNPICAETDEMAANKELLHRLFDNVINRNDLSLTESCIADDIRDHNPGPSDQPGRKGIQEVCKILRQAFPDLNGAIDDLVAEGDRIVIRWNVRGTNTCRCGGIGPTLRAIAGSGIDIVRVARTPDSTPRVTDRWGNSDDTGILLQLGLIPAWPDSAVPALLAV